MTRLSGSVKSLLPSGDRVLEQCASALRPRLPSVSGRLSLIASCHREGRNIFCYENSEEIEIS